MTRPMSEEYRNALAAERLRVVFLLEAEFVSGTVRIHTGQGELSWNGHTWTGLGNLIKLSDVSEGTGVRADALEVVVRMPPGTISQALAEVQQGAPATVYFALFKRSEAGGRRKWEIIADPVIYFRGQVDIPYATVGEDGGRLRISAENRMARYRLARGGLYSDAEQKRRFPGDRGLEFMSELAHGDQGIGRGGPLPGGGLGPADRRPFEDGGGVLGIQ